MFKVHLQGLNGLKAQFATATKDVKEIVSGEVQAAGEDFADGARRDSPIDQKGLRGAIFFKMDGELSGTVYAQKFYAPFMEFGTKGKYKPIPGTEAIAAQFKGYKGGDFQELLIAIVRWVARKGISGRRSEKTGKRLGSKITQFAEDYAAAWPIAMSIIRNGVKPHPFFFKQQEIVWPKMISNIKRVLESKTKVSVILPGEIRRPKIVTI